MGYDEYKEAWYTRTALLIASVCEKGKGGKCNEEINKIVTVITVHLESQLLSYSSEVIKLN